MMSVCPDLVLSVCPGLVPPNCQPCSAYGTDVFFAVSQKKKAQIDIGETVSATQNKTTLITV